MDYVEHKRKKADDRSTAVVSVSRGSRGSVGAVCRRFLRRRAAEGYHVLVSGRTQSKIDRIALTIRDRGPSAQRRGGGLTDATD